MKTRALVRLLTVALWLLVLGCLALVAQDANLPPATSNPLPSDFLLDLITKYPWLAKGLLAVGSLRLLLKPAMLAWEWYAKSTPNPNDDVAVLKFQSGPIYKVIAIGLDLLASVKVQSIVPPPPKKKS